jgi:hypothetical protein
LTIFQFDTNPPICPRTSRASWCLRRRKAATQRVDLRGWSVRRGFNRVPAVALNKGTSIFSCARGQGKRQRGIPPTTLTPHAADYAAGETGPVPVFDARFYQHSHWIHRRLVLSDRACPLLAAPVFFSAAHVARVSSDSRAPFRLQSTPFTPDSLVPDNNHTVPTRQKSANHLDP